MSHKGKSKPIECSRRYNRDMTEAASPCGPPEKTTERLVFRPAPAPLRGLVYACSSAVMAVIGTWFLWRQRGSIPVVLAILAAMFLLAALLITYSRWMDAGTLYEVCEQAIEYRNPLRTTRLEWRTVQEMRVLQAGSICRVMIIGLSGSFQFRLNREATLASDSSFPLGLPQGDQLARLVRGMAGLNHSHQTSDDTWIYQRETGL